MLTIIGCLLEGVVTKMSGMVLTAAPTFTFALLIVFVAVARWNLWGLLVIPFLAAANIIGGRLNDLNYLAAMYDWNVSLRSCIGVYVSSCLGLATVGLNVIVFKKYGTKKTMHQTGWMLLIVAVDYLAYSLIQFLAYRLITSGGLLHRGVLMYNFQIMNTETSLVEMIEMNLCRFGESGILFNLLGLVISVAGLFILRSQGVVNNVVDKLIEDKKNAEQIRLDEEKFTVQASEEAKQPNSDELE